MKEKNELLEILKRLDIGYKSYNHQPIYNVMDAEKYAQDIPGAHCKNLFLKNTEKHLYLAIILDQKRVDLKNLSKQLNSKRLSFASYELLEKTLNIKPGCVTPFALINSITKNVIVLLDRDILNEEKVSFHPLVNTETITISLADLLKFIDYCGQKTIIIENCIESY